MFKNGEEAKLLYPTEGFEADVSGRSFTHGRFVQQLRHAAACAPGVTVRQGTVKRLVNGEHPVPVDLRRFIGLGLLASMLKSKHLALGLLWSKEQSKGYSWRA